MKRIVKETLQNGEVQYRVEVKNLFNRKWHTDIWYSIDGCWFGAVFSNIEAAKIYCGIDINPVVKSEVVPTELENVTNHL